MKKFAGWLPIFWLLLFVAISPVRPGAQTASGSASNEDAAPATAEKAKSNRASKKDKPGVQPSKSQRLSKSETSGSASDSDIAAAKANGKVWVNLDSGIYHKSGRWYGRTKNGKFMTEAEAKAAGYKASQRN